MFSDLWSLTRRLPSHNIYRSYTILFMISFFISKEYTGYLWDDIYSLENSHPICPNNLCLEESFTKKIKTGRENEREGEGRVNKGKKKREETFDKCQIVLYMSTLSTILYVGQGQIFFFFFFQGKHNQFNKNKIKGKPSTKQERVGVDI